MKNHAALDEIRHRIFKPDLRTAFSRHMYALFALGICWGACLLVGLKLQTSGQSLGAFSHHGVFAVGCLLLVAVLVQFRNAYRAYLRMLDGHAELDDSDTICTYDRSISA